MSPTLQTVRVGAAMRLLGVAFLVGVDGYYYNYDDYSGAAPAPCHTCSWCASPALL